MNFTEHCKLGKQPTQQTPPAPLAIVLDDLNSFTILQYRSRGLQHLHARKMGAIWRLYSHVTRKLRASKNLHIILHAPFTRKIECTGILEKKDIFCYSYTQNTWSAFVV